jgi:nucleoside-diphosphate-sugar epimerase
MRVFVTGASGHIGLAVTRELLANGHEVVGLVRSDAGAAKVAAAGAQTLRGDLDDLDGLRAAAEAADGVIHLAFKHDWMRSGDFLSAVAADVAATEAIGSALEGSGKPYLTTGGTGMLAMGGISGRVGTEHDVLAGGPRVDAENYTVGLAERGVRSAVVRLPQVHGPLDQHGFLPTLIGMARAHGNAAYIGDGANRWPAAQTLDVARLYRLALESAPAGSRLHAVADEGVPLREIAGAIGKRLDLPVVSVSAEQADERFGFLSRFVAFDNPASSAWTRETLSWEPALPGLLADLAEPHYYEEPAAA